MKHDSVITLAPSRSGHIFIMMNIFSWLGCVEDWDELKFYNLENMSPHKFTEKKLFSIS